MSISNRHPLNLFIAGSSQALSGQRLARVGYKSSKERAAAFPSVCASVPVILADDILAVAPRILDHIRALLEVGQDGIIKSLYESAAGEMISVSDEDISLESIIAFLDASEQGNRLTKEILESWFNAHLADNLFIAFAEKLGFPEINADVTITVMKHVNAHKGMITALSGGKTSYNTKQCRGLLFDLSLCSAAGEEISGKLEKRLNKMIADAESSADALMLG